MYAPSGMCVRPKDAAVGNAMPQRLWVRQHGATCMHTDSPRILARCQQGLVGVGTSVKEVASVGLRRS